MRLALAAAKRLQVGYGQEVTRITGKDKESGNEGFRDSVMDRFKIHRVDEGLSAVQISGAKNAALPAMAAALLTKEPVCLKNIPHVRDIITMSKLLAHMRCLVTSPDMPPSEFTIQAETISHAEAPYDLVKTMRASVLTLGPLVARFGYARVSLPGGCAIGSRPVDLHIQALEELGASITVEHGYVEARAERLRGATFRFPKITVTGTENILTAAVLAEGETILENSALEPEVTDLAELLIKMGAKIEGLGTSTLRVQGVESLHGATHTIIPDRIEAGTFLVAGAITGGELLLNNCEPAHLHSIIAKLKECGVDIRCEGSGRASAREAPRTNLVAANLITENIPALPADMQARFMALATQATGVSTNPRDDIREPYGSRERNGAYGSEHHDRRQYCDGNRPRAPQRQPR